MTGTKNAFSTPFSTVIFVRIHTLLFTLKLGLQLCIKLNEVVTYPSIGTLYLSVIGPSTQCSCANYSSFAITSAQIWRPSMYSSYIWVENDFDSFEEVQMKIKEIDDRENSGAALQII